MKKNISFLLPILMALLSCGLDPVSSSKINIGYSIDQNAQLLINAYSNETLTSVTVQIDGQNVASYTSGFSQITFDLQPWASHEEVGISIIARNSVSSETTRLTFQGYQRSFSFETTEIFATNSYGQSIARFDCQFRITSYSPRYSGLPSLGNEYTQFYNITNLTPYNLYNWTAVVYAYDAYGYLLWSHTSYVQSIPINGQYLGPDVSYSAIRPAYYEVYFY